MIALPLDRIAEATRTRLIAGPAPAEAVTGPVVIDSREVSPGALFVALPGERADGHDFAAAAAQAGAAAVLAARPVEAKLPQLIAEGGEAPVVQALGRLARHVLDRLPDTDVVAVTGSSGKTTTKDLLSQVVARLGPTVAPVGSFNNEIGLPLTVLRADEATRFVVLEAAARGVGHIARLCGVAPPRIGAVLNVGSAHVGEFGGRAAIAEAKGELVEALPSAAQGGVAVLNADDAAVAGMARRTAARVVSFGLGAEATVRAEDVAIDAAGRASFTLRAAGRKAPVRLALAGEHMVSNALAVAAVALELGMGPAEAAEALTEARALSPWRMEVVRRPDGVTVVNDAYNANPESAAAALNTLHRMVDTPSGARAVAVLGHMAELGSAYESEHKKLGRLAAELGTDLVLAVGREAEPIVAGARSVGGWDGKVEQVADAEAAVARLGPWLRGGDAVIVKGSRVAALERVARWLAAEGGTQ